jgi:hypothetical protein
MHFALKRNVWVGMSSSKKKAKEMECNLTLSQCDVPLLTKGEGRFGEAKTG